MYKYFEENCSTVVLHCAGSCIYSVSVLLLLLLTDLKYELGKISSLLLIFILLFFEFIKFLLSNVCLSHSFDESFIRRIEHTLCKKYVFEAGIEEILKCFLVFGTAVFFYFIIFIVFGAEMFSKHQETLMLSLLLSVLTAVHACVNLGSHSALSAFFGKEPHNAIEIMVQSNIYGTFLGTWCGAFFIPLDWDRPWQEWPITCALGGLFGFIGSNFIFMCVAVHHQFKKRENNGRKML